MSAAKPLIDIRLTDGPVEVGTIDPFPPDAGAECVFLGRTRAETHPQHGELVRLEYEAHASMAVDVLRRLADRAVERFGCRAVRLLHAVGPVAVGEASVLVQIAGGHRAEAFEAARFLIDQLKREAPIWKHEAWERGRTWAQGTPIDASPTTSSKKSAVEATS